MGQRIAIPLGRQFGQWIVIGGPQSAGVLLKYRCRCECGQERMVRSDYLRYGTSRSCGGCLLPQTASGLDIHHAMLAWRPEVNSHP